MIILDIKLKLMIFYEIGEMAWVVLFGYLFKIYFEIVK